MKKVTLSKTKLRNLSCGFIYARINYGSTEHDIIVLTLCITSLEKSFPQERCIWFMFYQSRQPQGSSVWYQIKRKKIANKKHPVACSYAIDYWFSAFQTSRLPEFFFLKRLTNMAKRLKAIFLAEVVNDCLQSDDRDLDSSAGGLSSDEEEKVDNSLLENYSTESNRLVLVIFKLFSFYLFYDKNLVLIYYWHNCCKWFYLISATL